MTRGNISIFAITAWCPNFYKLFARSLRFAKQEGRASEFVGQLFGWCEFFFVTK
jgi:hypothetical protein